jgi:phosphoribosyl-ATP pyrophosphohydrolase/phosphoribosyl-AMP cyclohydrolase
MGVSKTKIKFDERGLVPAMAQDALTGEVLMLAYMNAEALKKTLKTKRAHYYSRSRGKLWLKGETSGHFQDVEEAYYDCDADAVLLKVRQTGVACHTGEKSCFYRRLDSKKSATKVAATAGVITELFKVLEERKTASPETSYVASLYKKGLPKILEKVAEESGEFMEAALYGKRGEIIHELADLWFHTLVLLASKDIEASELFGELDRRFGTSGHVEKASRKPKAGKKAAKKITKGKGRG